MKKKKQTKIPYAGSGYIIDNFRTSRRVYRHIWGLTADLPFTGEQEDKLTQRKNYHRLLSHIYAGMKQQAIMDKDLEDKEGFIPIYSRLIEKHFKRDLKVKFLRENNIIEMIPHDTLWHKSREFRIHEEVYSKLLEIEARITVKRWKNLGKKKLPKPYETVNLVTGRKSVRPLRNKLVAEGSSLTITNIPKLIKDSINALKACPFNPKYIEEWVEALNKKYLWEKQNFDEVMSYEPEDSPEYKKAKENLQVAKGRYVNDRTAQETITGQFPEIPKEIPKIPKFPKEIPKFPKRIPTEDTKGGRKLQEYQAAYTIQTSGRITEIHGGFQTASQMFKQKFIRHVPDIYNYDLKNSQANILIKELKHCKIDSTWMKDYMKDPNRKEELAKQIGIPVDVWKQCFYSMIMGADITGSHGAVYLTLEDHFNGNIKKTTAAVNAFSKTVKNLTRSAGKWRNYLYQKEDDRYHYQHAGIKFWKNVCGMKFKDYGLRKNNNGSLELIDTEKGKSTTNTKVIAKCKRRVAAFMLQGQEACFIHHLTILCNKNKIPVYKNEHDGIITGKKIPKKIITKAGNLSGLKNSNLIRKRLCSKRKVKEMKKFVKVHQGQSKGAHL